MNLVAADDDDDIFRGIGIEVSLPHATDTPMGEEMRADFLKVRETLTRIGDMDGDTLLQTCCIFHKKGRYVIAHYKELQSFDGDLVELTDEDVAIRNRVAKLLADWGLVRLEEDIEGPLANTSQFRILAYRDKQKYLLQPRYEIGRRKG